ncbi:unnamed protein product [Dovyalis caffra]|uniref:Uncharacterized protein n=1 Tax=Dovyalis caffra TaxID=77055 RepID=A0AAV1SBG7_9ROSI|nr:unnamed protein product [Dovyalis caffra]
MSSTKACNVKIFYFVDLRSSNSPPDRTLTEMANQSFPVSYSTQDTTPKTTVPIINAFATEDLLLIIKPPTVGASPQQAVAPVPVRCHLDALKDSCMWAEDLLRLSFTVCLFSHSFPASSAAEGGILSHLIPEQRGSGEGAKATSFTLNLSKGT